jgi:hypothetical protein
MIKRDRPHLIGAGFGNRWRIELGGVGLGPAGPFVSPERDAAEKEVDLNGNGRRLFLI